MGITWAGLVILARSSSCLLAAGLTPASRRTRTHLSQWRPVYHLAGEQTRPPPTTDDGRGGRPALDSRRSTDLHMWLYPPLRCGGGVCVCACPFSRAWCHHERRRPRAVPSRRSRHPSTRPQKDGRPSRAVARKGRAGDGDGDGDGAGAFLAWSAGGRRNAARPPNRLLNGARADGPSMCGRQNACAVRHSCQVTRLSYQQSVPTTLFSP